MAEELLIDQFKKAETVVTMLENFPDNERETITLMANSFLMGAKAHAEIQKKGKTA